MKKAVYVKICLFLCVFSLPLAHAQYENVWVFGNNAGIDFNGGMPQAIKTGISTREGCAAVCNDSGQLLFYTDGSSVWGRNHKLMMEGEDITGVGKNVTASTAQGALILPIPGTETLYYVFSLGSIENTRESGNLYRSIIDMSLNSGEGQVVEKAYLFAEGLTEHMTAVLGNRCDMWLIVSSYQENTFRSYHIDVNGIDTSPVYSTRLSGNDDYNGFIGLIDISPDRSRLAISQGGIFLYDFNPDDGTISNPYILDRNGFFQKYGLCFSPDNSKLYVETAGLLWQYDLSSNDTIKIQASRNLLAGTYSSALKRAPDGKIYSVGERGMLCVIHDPDQYGPACNFKRNDFSLAPNTTAVLGLPNVIKKVHYEYRNTITYDTGHCVDYMLLEPGFKNGLSYTWENGSRYPVRRVTQSGTYWVQYSVIDNPCLAIVDTFKVVVIPNQYGSNFQEIKVACEKDTVSVYPSSLGDSYFWNDGLGGTSRAVYTSGLYWVSYENKAECAHRVDSFQIDYPVTSYTVDFRSPAYGCAGYPLTFQNESSNKESSFLWTFGDGGRSTDLNPSYTYAAGGNFMLTLSGTLGKNCYDTQRRQVWIDSVQTINLTAIRDSLCLGEPHEFLLSGNPTSIRQLNWDFGDGATALDQPGQQHGHAYGDAGWYAVSLNIDFRACPADQKGQAVYVAPLPVVWLGNDTGLCPGSRPVLLGNRSAYAETPMRYNWSTGDTGAFIVATAPGDYTLKVSDPVLECYATDNIKVYKNCYLDLPNVFSPNGDGINDYFLPRPRGGRNVTAFGLDIYDRWGTLVFSSSELKGSGWDGTLSGREQPAGVYVYRVFLRWEGGLEESYNGDLSLIR